MAFKLKNKFTSGGLMGHSANQPKLNNSSKTPFFQQYQQEQDIKGIRVTKRDPVTGGATEGYTEQTVEFDDDQGLSYETVYDRFENSASGGKINPKTGVIYNNVDEFEADAIADRTKRTNYVGDIEKKDPVDGKPSYNTRLSINVLKNNPNFQDIPDFADELPYGKQKEMLFEALNKKNFKDDTKDTILENFKKEWEKQNNRKLTYNKSKKGTESKPGSTTYLGLRKD